MRWALLGAVQIPLGFMTLSTGVPFGPAGEIYILDENERKMSCARGVSVRRRKTCWLQASVRNAQHVRAARAKVYAGDRTPLPEHRIEPAPLGAASAAPLVWKGRAFTGEDLALFVGAVEVGAAFEVAAWRENGLEARHALGISEQLEPGGDALRHAGRRIEAAKCFDAVVFDLGSQVVPGARVVVGFTAVFLGRVACRVAAWSDRVGAWAGVVGTNARVFESCARSGARGERRG